MTDTERPPYDTFCRGCGGRLRFPGHPYVHTSGSCFSIWESSCLLNVERWARELVEGRSAKVGTQALILALRALDECRRARP
jgi:hypothetical protein